MRFTRPCYPVVHRVIHSNCGQMRFNLSQIGAGPKSVEIGPSKSGPVFQVAIGTPLMRLFDYLPPRDDATDGQRGQRILVPFGRTRRVGVICALCDDIRRGAGQVAPRDRDISTPNRCSTNTLMALLEWAAAYYHHPVGEVFSAALPGALRKGAAATDRGRNHLALDGRRPRHRHRNRGEAGESAGQSCACCVTSDAGLGRDDLSHAAFDLAKRAVGLLEKQKGLVERFIRDPATPIPNLRLQRQPVRSRRDEQRAAVETPSRPPPVSTLSCWTA